MTAIKVFGFLVLVISLAILSNCSSQIRGDVHYGSIGDFGRMIRGTTVELIGTLESVSAFEASDERYRVGKVHVDLLEIQAVGFEALPVDEEVLFLIYYFTQPGLYGDRSLAGKLLVLSYYKRSDGEDLGVAISRVNPTTIAGLIRKAGGTRNILNMRVAELDSTLKH